MLDDLIFGLSWFNTFLHSAVSQSFPVHSLPFSCAAFGRLVQDVNDVWLLCRRQYGMTELLSLGGIEVCRFAGLLLGKATYGAGTCAGRGNTVTCNQSCLSRAHSEGLNDM